MVLLIALHLLASVFWVGSMFFTLQVLRPVCIRTLEGPPRLKLMHGVMARFFSWVWLLASALLLTGYGMVFGYLGGMESVGWHVKAMLVLGDLMVVIFLAAYFIPFRKSTALILEEKYPAAGAQMEIARKMTIANLALGIILILAGSMGRYL